MSTGKYVEICGKVPLFECTREPGHEGDCEPLGSEGHNRRMLAAFQRVGAELRGTRERLILERVMEEAAEPLRHSGRPGTILDCGRLVTPEELDAMEPLSRKVSTGDRWTRLCLEVRRLWGMRPHPACTCSHPSFAGPLHDKSCVRYAPGPVVGR